MQRWGIDHFEQKLVKQYVRDSQFAANADGHLRVVYDWPIIEEVTAFSYKNDPAIALIARKVCDFISIVRERGEKGIWTTVFPPTKPKRLIHVGYGCDLSDLEEPIPYSREDYLLYTEQKGKRIFTVNIETLPEGDYVMTDGKGRLKNVDMRNVHDEGTVLGFIYPHRLRVSRGKKDSNLAKRAEKSFSDIVHFSKRLVPIM